MRGCKGAGVRSPWARAVYVRTSYFPACNANADRTSADVPHHEVEGEEEAHARLDSDGHSGLQPGGSGRGRKVCAAALGLVSPVMTIPLTLGPTAHECFPGRDRWRRSGSGSGDGDGGNGEAAASSKPCAARTRLKVAGSICGSPPEQRSSEVGSWRGPRAGRTSAGSLPWQTRCCLALKSREEHTYTRGRLLEGHQNVRSARGGQRMRQGPGPCPLAASAPPSYCVSPLNYTHRSVQKSGSLSKAGLRTAKPLHRHGAWSRCQVTFSGGGGAVGIVACQCCMWQPTGLRLPCASPCHMCGCFK